MLCIFRSRAPAASRAAAAAPIAVTLSTRCKASATRLAPPFRNPCAIANSPRSRPPLTGGPPHWPFSKALRFQLPSAIVHNANSVATSCADRCSGASLPSQKQPTKTVSPCEQRCGRSQKTRRSRCCAHRRRDGRCSRHAPGATKRSPVKQRAKRAAPKTRKKSQKSRDRKKEDKSKRNGSVRISPLIGTSVRLSGRRRVVSIRRRRALACETGDRSIG